MPLFVLPLRRKAIRAGGFALNIGAVPSRRMAAHAGERPTSAASRCASCAALVDIVLVLFYKSLDSFRVRSVGIENVALEVCPESLARSPSCPDFGRRCAGSFPILGVACILVFVCWGLETSRAEEPAFDKAVYDRAVEFCRGAVKRPMALDLDKRVLCFDGEITSELDGSLFNALEPNGLFVIRSVGGDPYTAMTLAEILRVRHAIVVAYDYCFSACASFFLVASDQAFVMKDTLVAWHPHGATQVRGEYYRPCFILDDSKDGGPKRLETSTCAGYPGEIADMEMDRRDSCERFFAPRIVNPRFMFPPESVAIRRMLRNLLEDTGRYPDEVTWTWNPRHYAGMIKTKIVYEAYPASQDEVDAMAAKLHLSYRVLYDP
jgi:hypothetical protein